MKRSLFLSILIASLAACAGAPKTKTSEEHVGGEAVTEESQDDGDTGVTSIVALGGDFIGSLETAVTSFGAATDGKHVYMLGGYHGEPHSYSREGQSKSFLRLPIEGGEPELLTETPHGLQGLALVHVDGKICAFGGNHAENGAGEETRMVSRDGGYCYTIADGSWARLPSMPEGRSSFEADAIGSTVYIAGGWKLSGEARTGEFHKTLLSIDLSEDEPAWRAIEAPFTRRAIGVGALGGKLYIIGGIDEGGDITRRVDIFDPETGEFTVGPDFPGHPFGVAVEPTKDAIYASGRDGAVYRYRGEGSEWEHVGNLHLARFFHHLVATPDGALLAVGGISGMHTRGRTRLVERFVPDSEGARLASFTVKGVGEAKNRQGLFVKDETLYFFGGNRSLEQHDFEPHHFTAQGLTFHIPSLQFAEITDYPAARQTMSTMLVGEKGFALGGFGHDGEAAVSQREGFVFDFESGKFSPSLSFETSRTQFGLTEHEGAFYVFGGLNYDPAREERAFDHVTTILRAEGLDGKFEEIETQLPGQRRAFAGGALDGKYYLIGGMREGFQLVEDCISFDFATSAIEEISCPDKPRLSGELLAIGDKLYLVGGSVREDGAENLSDSKSIEVYDPATDSWSTLVEELPFGMRHTRALVYNDNIMLVSTHFEENELRIALIHPGR